MGDPQKILERRKIKTVLGAWIACSCGKKFRTSVTYYKSVAKSMDTGELKDVFTKVSHDYPRITCHCKCGVKWGNHYKHYYYN